MASAWVPETRFQISRVPFVDLSGIVVDGWKAACACGWTHVAETRPMVIAAILGHSGGSGCDLDGGSGSGGEIS